MLARSLAFGLIIFIALAIAIIGLLVRSEKNKLAARWSFWTDCPWFKRCAGRKDNNPLRLAVSLLFPLLAGFIGSQFTTPAIKSWYALLTKPSFNPPNWLFGPVWTTLFILMGIALFLVWKSRSDLKDLAMVSFFFQLILNVSWSVLFFYFHNPLAALLEIVGLWLAIAANIFFFSRVDKRAAWLLVPYLAWVSFASFLNYTIWRLN